MGSIWPRLTEIYALFVAPKHGKPVGNNKSDDDNCSKSVGNNNYDDQIASDLCNHPYVNFTFPRLGRVWDT